MADENIKKPANFNFYLNTQGVRGRKGEKGDPGFSPTITVSEDTLNTYKLKVVTVDGEFETANLRGSIIAEGEGSYIRYDATTDKLYVADLDEATETSIGGVRIASDADYEALESSAVVTVVGLDQYLQNHLKTGDDSVKLSYDENTGIITITATGGASGVSSYNELTDKPELYGTTITGNKKLSDFVKIKEPLVETTGVDYETDAVIKNGTITENALIFQDDWYPLFSSNSTFTCKGAYTITSGPDMLPNSYLSIPYKLGDIIEMPAATGADIIAGVMNADNSQFVSQFVLRIDGLSAAQNRRAVLDITSKSQSGNELVCGFNIGAEINLNSWNFDRVTSYFQITLDTDGNPIFTFVKNTASGVYGSQYKFTSDLAKQQVSTFNRILFGGTDILSNPINQMGIYHITDGKKLGVDLKGNVDIDKLHNYLNLSFPDAENALSVKYDGSTIILDSNSSLKVNTDTIATKASVDTVVTEVKSLDDRVTALEDTQTPIATTSTPGKVKPDGTTITITADGTISSVGGGSGGTDDYSALINKPQINSVELIGNTALSTLDIQGTITPKLPLNINVSEEGPTKGLAAGPEGSFNFTTNSYSAISTSGSGYWDINGLNFGAMPSSGTFQLKDDYFINYIDIPIEPGYTVAIPTDILVGSITLGYKNDSGEFRPTFAPYYYSTGNVYGQTISADTGGFGRIGGNPERVRFYGSFGWSSRSAKAGFVTQNRYIQIGAAANAVYFLHGGDFANNATTMTIPAGALTEFQKTKFVRILGGAVDTSYNISNFKLLDTTGKIITNLTDESELSTLPNLFNPSKSVITRMLQLGFDNDTLKLNSSNQLYADVSGLPGDITASSTDSTITLSSTKALEFDVPTMYAPDNLVHKGGDTENLYLHQGAVEAGTNITVDKTATGIKINSSGGGEIDPSVLDAKQDKLNNTASIVIEDTSINIPADTYTLVGNATVSSENVLTGTQANNYLKIPKVFNPGAKSWEIVARVNPNSAGLSASTYVPLFAEETENKAVPQLYLRQGKVRCDVALTSSSWDVEELMVSNFTMTAGTYYYLRLRYDGNGTYYVGASTDGVTYTENSQNAGGPCYQSSNSIFIIGADAKTYGSLAYNGIDLNNTYIKIDNEYFWHPFVIQEEGQLGANVKLSQTAGNAISIKDDGLFVSQGASTSSVDYGIQADYATRHGILDCPNGLIDFSTSNKSITLNSGIVLNCAGNGTAKTTIASPITHTLTSSAGTITLFYASGELLECGKVDYSTTEPADNGVDNYQAWFNPDLTVNPNQQWQFKSNDTGNVFRPASSATPIADIVIGETGVTSVSYIGYRIFDDDIIAQLSDVENIQEIVTTLQTTIAELQTRVAALETKVDGGNV